MEPPSPPGIETLTFKLYEFPTTRPGGHGPLLDAHTVTITDDDFIEVEDYRVLIRKPAVTPEDRLGITGLSIPNDPATIAWVSKCNRVYRVESHDRLLPPPPGLDRAA